MVSKIIVSTKILLTSYKDNVNVHENLEREFVTVMGGAEHDWLGCLLIMN